MCTQVSAVLVALHRCPTEQLAPGVVNALRLNEQIIERFESLHKFPSHFV